VRAALKGNSTVTRDSDDDGPETAVAIPLPGTSGVLGVVLGGGAALLGLWLARGLSRPLLALEAASARLGLGDLGARAPVQGPSEIAAPAPQFNNMAAPLGDLITTQQQFVADASHQPAAREPGRGAVR
jgi:methyl-accepting chemotaxis protein